MNCLAIFGSDAAYEIQVNVEIRRHVDPFSLGHALSEVETICASVKITIRENESTLTFEWLIQEAVRQFGTMNVNVESEGGVVGIKHNGVMVFDDILVVDFCKQISHMSHRNQREDPSYDFDLICGGHIYKLDDQMLLLIVEYLGKNPRHLVKLREICTLFARVFSSCEVWDLAQKELEQEFQLYTGLCVGVSNGVVSTDLWLREESILPRLSAARVRWISLKSSRLAIYLGSTPLPSPSIATFVRESALWLLYRETSPVSMRQKLRNCVFVAGKAKVSTLVHETMALLLPESSIEGQRLRGAVLVGHTEVSRTANYRNSPRHEMPDDRLAEYTSMAPSERTRMVQRLGYSTLGDDRLVFVRQHYDNHDPILTRPRTLGLVFTAECRLNVEMVLERVPASRDFDETRETSQIQQALLDLPETAQQEEALRRELARLWDCYACRRLQTFHAHKGYTAAGTRAHIEMLHDSALLTASELARPLLLLLCVSDMGQRQPYKCWSGANDSTGPAYGEVLQQLEVESLHPTEEPTPAHTTGAGIMASGSTDDEFLEVCNAAWSKAQTRKEMQIMAVEAEQRVRRLQRHLAQQICASFWVRRAVGLLSDLIKGSRNSSEHSRRWHVQAVNLQLLESLGFTAKPLATKTKETLAKSGLVCGVNAFIRAISANNTRASV